MYATASDDGTVRVWKAESGEEMLVLSDDLGPVKSVGFSPDGTRLATGGEDESAKIWDIESGQVLQTLTGHRGTIMAVVFTPDGSQLVTAGEDGTAKVWDTESGQELLTLSGHANLLKLNHIAVSPDGSRLATACPKTRHR